LVGSQGEKERERERRRQLTFDSDEDGGVVLARPVVRPRDARVVGAVRLLDAVDRQARPGRPAGRRRRQRDARVGVGRERAVAVAVPRHVRRPPAPRAAVEHQRAAGDDAVRPVETAHVRVRWQRRTRRQHSQKCVSTPGPHQTWNWVIGSPGQWVIRVIFHVRVTGSSF